MKFAKRLKAAINIMRRGSHIDIDADYCPGITTKSNQVVNQNTALTLSGLYNAMTILGSLFGSMPKTVNRRLPGGGSERATTHPLFDRLYRNPNDSTLMTSWQWFFTQLIHKYFWGNWYTYIDRRNYYNQQLIPLFPDRTCVNPENPNQYFTEINKKRVIIPKRKMLHIPHFSTDGISGKGILHYAADSVGTSLSLEEFAATFFKNGTHAGGIVELDKPLKPEDRERHMADFNEKYSGLGKFFSVIWLSGGAKFKAEEVDLSKYQAIEQRQYSVIEAARWMNMPPHILKDLSRATFSNIEQQFSELIIITIMPLVTQIEQAMDIAFFDKEEREEYFVKIEMKGLLRGDIKSRTEFYTALLDRGVLNADEVRGLEDMNPQADGQGKYYFVPINFQNKLMALKPQPVQETNNRQIHKRSVAHRRNLTNQYLDSWREAGTSIVSEEVELIRDAISKYLETRSRDEFENWLRDFYKEFKTTIKKIIYPIILSYSGDLLSIAQNEINSQMNIAASYQVFQSDYVDYFVDRYTRSSKGQLNSLLNNDGSSEDINERLNEWQEKRPDKIKNRESYRAESAFTREIFLLCGIKKIQSIAYGKNCPYCDALDGTIIGINDSFLSVGDFQPEGAETPLNVTSIKRHPPYHDGCDCGVGPAN